MLVVNTPFGRSARSDGYEIRTRRSSAASPASRRSPARRPRCRRSRRRAGRGCPSAACRTCTRDADRSDGGSQPMSSARRTVAADDHRCRVAARAPLRRVRAARARRPGAWPRCRGPGQFVMVTVPGGGHPAAATDLALHGARRAPRVCSSRRAAPAATGSPPSRSARRSTSPVRSAAPFPTAGVTQRAARRRRHRLRAAAVPRRHARRERRAGHGRVRVPRRSSGACRRRLRPRRASGSRPRTAASAAAGWSTELLGGLDVPPVDDGATAAGLCP